MTRPSQQELWAETAELAERFGWSLDAILDLEHRDRHRLLAAARERELTRGSERELAAARLGLEGFK
jgi:hypothetical protein